MIEVMVKHFGQGCRLRYFCQDETRLGLKTMVGKRITVRGTKPIQLVQWPRENFWLYGAVEPSTGQHFFYSFSHLDAVCFEQFVHYFAAVFADTINLLHLDQAKAHVATTLTWPENVIPMFQPSHSPELNPMERVWQELKKLFKGLNFESLATFRQQVFEQVNAFTNSTLHRLTGWAY